MNYYEEALKLHEKHQGKIHTELNCEINTMDDMSVVYTPGVAEPCRKIAENEEDVYRYTTKSNTIAVRTWKYWSQSFDSSHGRKSCSI